MDGGALLLTTPNFGSVSRRLLGKRWRVIDPEHLVLFTGAGLQRALQRCGFRIRSIRSRNVDPTEIMRVLQGKTTRTTQDRQRMVDACRNAIEAHQTFTMLKKALNGLFARLSIGDTLEAWAER